MVEVLGFAENGGEIVRNKQSFSSSKKRLSYITVAAVFVLVSVFVGVHTVGVKDSYAHTQLLQSQQQSRKYSQSMPGRDGGKVHQVVEILSKKISQSGHQEFSSLSTALSDSGLLSSVSPRGPPVSRGDS